MPFPNEVTHKQNSEVIMYTCTVGVMVVAVVMIFFRTIRKGSVTRPGQPCIPVTQGLSRVLGTGSHKIDDGSNPCPEGLKNMVAAVCMHDPNPERKEKHQIECCSVISPPLRALSLPLW